MFPAGRALVPTQGKKKKKMCIGAKKIRFILSDYSFKEKESSSI